MTIFEAISIIVRGDRGNKVMGIKKCTDFGFRNFLLFFFEYQTTNGQSNYLWP